MYATPLPRRRQSWTAATHSTWSASTGGSIMRPPGWTSPKMERSSRRSFQPWTASPMSWPPRPRIGTRPIPATLACEVDSRRGFLGRVHPLHGRAVMLVEAMTFAQRTGGADTARNLPAGADAAATDRLGHGHHRGRHSARPCTDRVAPWCRRHWPACRCTRPTRISPFSAGRRGAGGIEAGRGSSSGDQSETRQAMKMSV